jgi:hypothetical protein
LNAHLLNLLNGIAHHEGHDDSPRFTKVDKEVGFFFVSLCVR